MQHSTIAEAINKNIERHQFPNFQNHRTLMGWSSMNYSSKLKNSIFEHMPQDLKVQADSEMLYKQQNKELEQKLSTLYQSFRDTEYKNRIKKPFQTMNQQKNDKIPTLPEGFKHSVHHLTTTDPEIMGQTLKNFNIVDEKYLQYQPVDSSIDYLEKKKKEIFNKAFKQLGDVSYQPKFESENLRHLQNFPNQILTEQSLMQILSQRITHLNISNHTWISIEMIGQIGYMSPNIQNLNLSQTLITDSVLLEIGKTCQSLTNIDLSKCLSLTSDGISKFIKTKPNLIRINLEHNQENTVNDESLYNLSYCKNLEDLNVNYCHSLSDIFLINLEGINKIKSFSVAGNKNFSKDGMIAFLSQVQHTLQKIDLSFVDFKDFNQIITKIQTFTKLEDLNLTGCHFQNTIFNQFMQSQQGDGYEQLKILKLSGCRDLNEYCVKITIQNGTKLINLDLDGTEVNDQILIEIPKYCKNLKKLSINLTAQVTPQGIDDLQKQMPNLQIFRNGAAYFDPKDDGLRMPFVLKTKVLKKPAKKKKKK